MQSSQDNAIPQEISALSEQCVNDEYQNLERLSSCANSSASSVNEEEPYNIDDLFLCNASKNINYNLRFAQYTDPVLLDDTPDNDRSTLDTKFSAFSLNNHQDKNNENHIDLHSSPLLSTNSTQNDYPKGNKERYGENEWSIESLPTTEELETKYYIRNHYRESINILDNEDMVELAFLKEKCTNTINGEDYWFHATTWEKAQQFIQFGPNFTPKLADFSPIGGFYLNPSYEDCYNWFITSNSRFRGYHAMMIYKFDSNKISENGEIPNSQQWKEIAMKRTERMRRRDPDWSLVYQNADPTNIKNRGKKQRARWTKDGQRAMQLIIRRKRICDKIRKCLVGCIFYRKIMSTNEQKNNQINLQDLPKHTSSFSNAILESSENITERSFIPRQEGEDDAHTDLETELDTISNNNNDHLKFSSRSQRPSRNRRRSNVGSAHHRSMKHKDFSTKNLLLNEI